MLPALVYTTFFRPARYATLTAICDHLIPADEVGPGAVESGVPEFLDRHNERLMPMVQSGACRGRISKASADFGYQGKLTLREILSVGLDAMDAHCKQAFGGKTFKDLDARSAKICERRSGGKLELMRSPRRRIRLFAGRSPATATS